MIVFRVTRMIIAVLILLQFAACLHSRKAGNSIAVANANSLLLFAHRGVTVTHPENTEAAFAAAKNKGFRAIEVDIQQSADDVLVVFHDEDGRRLLNVDSSIENMHLKTIKKHPVIYKKKKSNSYVLTLEEVFAKYSRDFIIYLDVKVNDIGVFKQVAKLIKKHRIETSVIVASSSAKCIFYTELRHPSVHTALEGFNSGKEWVYHIIPKRLQPDFYSGSYKKITANHVDWLRKKKLFDRRIVFDVDSSNYHDAVESGLRNLIVDYFVPSKSMLPDAALPGSSRHTPEAPLRKRVNISSPGLDE